MATKGVVTGRVYRVITMSSRQHVSLQGGCHCLTCMTTVREERPPQGRSPGGAASAAANNAAVIAGFVAVCASDTLTIRQADNPVVRLRPNQDENGIVAVCMRNTLTVTLSGTLALRQTDKLSYDRLTLMSRTGTVAACSSNTLTVRQAEAERGPFIPKTG